jgi:flagellar hook protein FlgE
MNVMNAALGGMLVAQGSLERTAQRIAGASAKPTAEPTDTVDLSTEMVNLLAARNDFKANAQVFHAGDQMQKKLLDILA